MKQNPIRIFVIGQSTLHWGRIEFGNIGNLYVAEPFYLELHRAFPNAKIRTTLQMSDDFCKRTNVECVPMDWYYGWTENDLPNAYKELAIASAYKETGTLIDTTPFISEVLSSDLVVDLSGDIWGENADLVGANRFLVGLIKDRVAQLLGKPTAMLAGSPGPFNRDNTLSFAHLVFKNFDLVTNREPVSRGVLESFGFDLSKLYDCACPAFLFKAASQESIKHHLVGTVLEKKDRPVVGFVLCGWNMLQGPFSREDWRDEEFGQYVSVIRKFIKKYNVRVCLMSHSNGFKLPPKPHFEMIHGRDYPIMEQLYKILKQTDVADSVSMLTGIYLADETKAIVSNFDMVVSGRVHAAVGALSQSVPTVIIDYGHEPKAHKLKGFATIAGMEEYVANPADENDIWQKVEQCWINRKEINSFLEKRNIEVEALVHANFDILKNVYDSKTK